MIRNYTSKLLTEKYKYEAEINSSERMLSTMVANRIFGIKFHSGNRDFYIEIAKLASNIAHYMKRVESLDEEIKCDHDYQGNGFCGCDKELGLWFSVADCSKCGHRSEDISVNLEDRFNIVDTEQGNRIVETAKGTKVFWITEKMKIWSDDCKGYRSSRHGSIIKKVASGRYKLVKIKKDTIRGHRLKTMDYGISELNCDHAKLDEILKPFLNKKEE